MTWGEFKQLVESRGVRNDHIMEYVDCVALAVADNDEVEVVIDPVTGKVGVSN